MTATQAPTPGPLSVDDGYDGHYSDCAIHNAPALPVGPCDCGSPFLSPDDIKRAKDLRYDPDSEDNERFASWYGDTLLDVHALALRQSSMLHRLAPTAPVEASGSEREHGPKCWGKTSASDEMAHCYCGSTDLRPQPSGETRKAVAAIIKAFVSGPHFSDPALYEAMDQDRLIAADRILALLSARPLALGGQQGDSETLRVLLDNLVIAQTLSKDIRQKATDEARSCLYGRRHTPARAEDQDEGAEMTRLLKLADSALANVTAFEDDARYIMGNTNYAITENARSEIRSFLLAQSAKTSVRPKALEILERLLDHSGARGSFDAMKHGDAVKDAEELLHSARSPGHTDLMVTPESIDAYMKDNPMEAQDEGAADALRFYALGQQDNGHRAKEALARTHPSPPPAADEDRVRELEAALLNIALMDCYTREGEEPIHMLMMRLASDALKSTAAKEGEKK